MTAGEVGRVEGRGVEQKGNRSHGHGHQCGGRSGEWSINGDKKYN